MQIIPPKIKKKNPRRKRDFSFRTIECVSYCPLTSEPMLPPSETADGALQAFAAALNVVQAEFRLVIQEVFAVFTEVLNADHAAFTAVFTSAEVVFVYAAASAVARAEYALCTA
jgi:hypothetical protein